MKLSRSMPFRRPRLTSRAIGCSLLAALALACAPSSASQDALSATGVAAPRAAEVLEIGVPTAMRDEDLPALVVLPSAYTVQPDRAFPTLYLLHGAGGTHRSWVDATDVEALAEQHEVIVVCPDGGRTSWYFDSPLDPRYQFETFTAQELVAHIDANFRTRRDRNARAIGGLSMGGHGALFLAIRHSDVFGTALVMSGGVDIRPFAGNWDIAKRIGSIEAAPKLWDELTVIHQARNLQPGRLAISIDCGVDDFFLGVNRALHTQLVEAQIPHDYTERPGGHTWGYWERSLPYQVLFASEQFAK